jgi:chemotaxis protein MotB
MKREKEEVEEPTAPFWMTTYGDMVTLMLCFFVLIVSFSQIEVQKFRGAMESMRGALSVFQGHESIQQKEYIDFDANQSSEQISLVERAEVVQKVVEQLNLKDAVSVETTAEGMRVRLGSAILFPLGSADLIPAAFPVLHGIATAVEGAYKEIQVQGNTDDIPIGTDKFPSNWELSAARASSVVRYLYQTEGIPPSKMAAVGYGEFRPIVSNTTEANRKKNRRVEIFIRWR